VGGERVCAYRKTKIGKSERERKRERENIE